MCGCVCVWGGGGCTFQPGNFTSCGSEGVKDNTTLNALTLGHGKASGIQALLWGNNAKFRQRFGVGVGR